MHRHRHMMIGDNECNEMAWYGHGPLRVPRRLLAPSIISVTEVRTIRGAGAPASLAPRAHAASGANGPQGGPTGLLPWLPNHQTQLLLRSFLCCRLACFARLHGRGTSRDHAVFFSSVLCVHGRIPWPGLSFHSLQIPPMPRPTPRTWVMDGVCACRGGSIAFWALLQQIELLRVHHVSAACQKPNTKGHRPLTIMFF